MLVEEVCLTWLPTILKQNKETAKKFKLWYERKTKINMWDKEMSKDMKLLHFKKQLHQIVPLYSSHKKSCQRLRRIKLEQTLLQIMNLYILIILKVFIKRCSRNTSWKLLMWLGNGNKRYWSWREKTVNRIRLD